MVNKTTKNLIKCMLVLIFVAGITIFIVLPLVEFYKPVFSDNETTNQSITGVAVVNGTGAEEPEKPKAGTIFLIAGFFVISLGCIIFFTKKKMPFYAPDQQHIIDQLRNKLIKDRGLHFEDGKGCVLQIKNYYFGSKRQFPRLLVIFSLKRRSIYNIHPDPSLPPRKNIVTVDLPFRLPVKKYNFLGHFYLKEALEIIVDSHFGRAPPLEPEKQELFPMAGESKAKREGELEGIRERAKARIEEGGE